MKERKHMKGRTREVKESKRRARKNVKKGTGRRKINVCLGGGTTVENGGGNKKEGRDKEEKTGEKARGRWVSKTWRREKKGEKVKGRKTRVKKYIGRSVKGI